MLSDYICSHIPSWLERHGWRIVLTGLVILTAFAALAGFAWDLRVYWREHDLTWLARLLSTAVAVYGLLTVCSVIRTLAQANCVLRLLRWRA
jgi:hypothetical protein